MRLRDIFFGVALSVVSALATDGEHLDFVAHGLPEHFGVAPQHKMATPAKHVTPAEHPEQAEHAVHWGYTGHGSPEHWGDLGSGNAMCKLGRNQAPINIKKEIEVDSKGLEPLKFHYASGAKNIINNGHTVQVDVEDGSSLQIDKKSFTLKQFHFHTPSENEIDSKLFPLEAHLVHVAEDGSIAVVAILFEEGKPNPLLEKVFAKMPKKEGEVVGCGLNAKALNDFLPKKRAYYRFEGSLTTPPCSEGVRWFVFKAYNTVSKEQVEAFAHVMHHPNNRPVQDIGARKVLE